MKFTSLLIASGFLLVPISAQADTTQLSPERLDMLDQLGIFTPAFKAAIHDMVDAKQSIVTAKKDEQALSLQVPDLKAQADAAEKEVAALRQQLAEYDHTDEADFAQLQKKMADASALPEDQRVLSQAYLWAYPASPRTTEVQQYLEQAQKKLADQAQAEKDAEAARVAAHEKLLERVKARDLSLAEWRDFLRDMSQEDLIKYLGQPDSQGADYWIYSGDWTHDPVTNDKIGMRINLNAGRVISISKIAHE